MVVETTQVFKIKSFQSGINQYVAEGLLKPFEAVECSNANISSGSLKTFSEPVTWHTEQYNINNIIPFHDFKISKLLLNTNGHIVEKGSSSSLYDTSKRKLDYVNFQYKDKRVLVCVSKQDTPFMYKDGACHKLLNRRVEYNKDTGEISGYIDANGLKHETESEVKTYAPKGDFMELHYDRLWIAGEEENPDRVYFSTANTHGADIQDFTAPLTEEDEINMHGGFIDVRSFDGTKIIGMKVIFDSIVIFKNKSAFKVFGSSPANYKMVQLFNCSGAIADKSICVGSNGAYFLNSDGIYYFDGTNTALVSQKICNYIKRMNLNYADKSVAIFKDNKYYLAIPIDDSVENNLLIEYDTNFKSFTTYNIGKIDEFYEQNNKLYYVSGNVIKELFTGTNCLPLIWETPLFDFGTKNARKMSSYIYFRAKGNGKIKFTLTTEKKEKILEVQLTENEEFYRKKLKNKGRMFKLKIENVDNSNFELVSPELFCESDQD